MKRIEILDLWRSVAILLMMAYHLIYDLHMFGAIPTAALRSPWAYALRYAAAGSFLLISGLVVRFSRSSVRRGAVVFACGMLVTVVMKLAVGLDVQFGILHLLGTLMIAYGLISKRAEVPRGVWFPVVCAAMFAVTFYIYDTVRVDARWLYPIGLRCHGFTSADYYPLLPWGLLFAIGVWLGGRLAAHREHPLLSRRFHPALTFLGRHSLIVYLAHQPILYGVCWLLFSGG